MNDVFRKTSSSRFPREGVRPSEDGRPPEDEDWCRETESGRLLRKTEEEDGGPPEMEDLRSFLIG